MEYSKFSFSKPQLFECSFELNGKFKETSKPIEMSTNFLRETNLDEANKLAEVVLTVDIGKEEDNAPFFIKVKMGAKFKWNELDFADNEVKNFINCNAPALLIGYIRPVVAFLTTQSPYPPYHMPFVDLSDERAEEMVSLEE